LRLQVIPLRRWLQRAASLAVHGGAWQLRAYESRILQAAADSLPAADAAVLRTQLQALEHLKRLHADRMVTFYFFDAAQLPRISLAGPELCIAQFRVKAAGIEGLRASVVTHLGLLSSLEFSSSPAGLSAVAGFELLPVRGRKRSTVADDIDREEHP
jgi:hypothetical protein